MIRYYILLLTTFILFSQNNYDKFMQTYVDDHKFNGVVLVAHKGNIIFHKAYGFADFDMKIPLQTHHQFLIGSLTKTFTALLTVVINEKKKRSFNTPIHKSLPELKSILFHVPIKRLIQMNTGLSSRIEPYVKEVHDEINETELLSKLDQKLSEFNITDEFNYSNLSFNLAALVLSNQEQESYKELIFKHITHPLLMTDSFVLRNSDQKNIAIGYNIMDRSNSGNPEKGRTYNMSLAIGSGDIVSTTEDLLKLDQALYKRDFISEQNKNLLFTSHGEKYGDYGFGFKIKDYNRETLGSIGTLARHGGSMDGYLANFHRYIDDQLTVIVLSNVRPIPIMDITVGLKETFFGRKMKERNGIY